MIFKLPTKSYIDIDQICYAVACQVEGKDEPTRNILHSAKQMLNARITEVEQCFPSVTEHTLVISDANNFRKWKTPDYKGNRPPKPEALGIIRDYMVEKRGAIVRPFLEADDVTAMFHNRSHEKGNYSTVLVDQDKDLDQIPGWRIVPSLKREGKVTRKVEVKLITPHQAAVSFYTQMLSGDSTDGIPGLFKMTGTRVSKQMKEGIQGCETEWGMWNYVYDMWCNSSDLDPQALFPILTEIGNNLYMRRFPNDYWLPPRRQEDVD